MSESKKRTPSPRVMAAKLLYECLEGPYFRSPDDLTELFGTKVSDAKRTKVVAALDKLSDKFRERMRLIVRRFEQPPPRKPKEEKT